MPVPDEQYFLEVESHFAARRGTPFIFSARDWALLKGWKEEGVPLPVVLEAIDRCFDKRQEGGRRRTVSSLSYCRHAVRELWDDRKDLQVGADGSVPENDPGEQLDRLAAQLRQSSGTAGEGEVSARLTRAADDVAALPAGESVPKLEERLIELEGALVDDLLRILPPSRIEALVGEIDRTLRGYEKGMDPKTLARTREANLRRAVRSELAIPRLSLFG